MNFLQQTYKGKTDWWRWLIILAVFFTPFLSDFFKTYYVKLVLPTTFKPENKNLYIIINSSLYIILLFVFILLFRLIHKRSFLSLITARKKFDWLKLWFSFGTWGTLILLMFLSSLLYAPDSFDWNFKLIPFVKYFFICVLLIPFQILFQTALMRGYLLQGVGFVFRKPWVSLLITSSVYCFFMYIQNKEITNLVGNEIFIHYIGLTFLIVLITILDDGLEIALGMTFANNLVASLLITNRSFHLDSILVNNGEINTFILVYVTVFLLCPLYFILLKKIYKWSDWKEKLFNEVEKI